MCLDKRLCKKSKEILHILVGNVPKKWKIYCIKLILGTQHIQAIPVSQAVTAQSVRKTEQHFHKVTVVQQLRCPWAHSPKQGVTADYLEAKLILEGRHPI